MLSLKKVYRFQDLWSIPSFVSSGNKTSKFLCDRAAYVWEIEECSNQADTFTAIPVSLYFSVDASLLASLVELRRMGAEIDMSGR
jgi:hypothetical protein